MRTIAFLSNDGKLVHISVGADGISIGIEQDGRLQKADLGPEARDNAVAFMRFVSAGDWKGPSLVPETETAAPA
jgi:hypothetical protein